MQNLNEIYERDMSKLSDEKKAALQAVEDMKSTMLESKLSEVSHIRYSACESHTLLCLLGMMSNALSLIVELRRMG